MTFTDIENALRSTRLLMMDYIINILKNSYDGKFIFNDMAFSVINNEIMPLRLELDGDNKTCKLFVKTNNETYYHLLSELSCDDLHGLCIMINDMEIYCYNVNDFHNIEDTEIIN